MGQVFVASVTNKRGDVVDSCEADTREAAALAVWSRNPGIIRPVRTERGRIGSDTRWHSLSEMESWRAAALAEAV